MYYGCNLKLKILVDSGNQTEVSTERLNLFINRTEIKNVLNIYLHHGNMILYLVLYFGAIFKIITFTLVLYLHAYIYYTVYGIG